jgi:CRP-like cAMP-binding protein
MDANSSLTPVPLTVPSLWHAKPLRWAKHEDVLLAGQPSRSIYVNQDAWFARYKLLHDGSRQIVDFVLPGEMFGLQACVFKTSLYTVTAITPGSGALIECDKLEELLNGDPSFTHALLWSALLEAARMGEHVTNAGRRSAYERLAHFFLELHARLRRSGLAQGTTFSTPLTQELIADALGLTTIHVNRTLRLLRDQRLIAIDGKQVTILDFAALSRVCDFDPSYLGDNARALLDTPRQSSKQ